MLWAVSACLTSIRFSVNRQEELRRVRASSAFGLLTTMTRYVNFFTSIDNFSTLHHQPINGVYHSNRVAWDRIENTTVSPERILRWGCSPWKSASLPTSTRLENLLSESGLSHRAMADYMQRLQQIISHLI